MSGYESVLIRYGELSLKGGNRSHFENQLVHNIGTALDGCSHGPVQRRYGGIRLLLNSDSPVEEISHRLRHVSGIAWFAPAWNLERDTETLAKVALERGQDKIQQANTFAIETQRSDKEFHLNSEEISRIVGGIIDEETDLSVDLDNPDWTVHIHVLKQSAYVFFDRFRGIQGLPVGTTGSVITQLSGGIDSPVSAIMTLNRGCETDFIHFYSYPSSQIALDNGIGPLVDQIAPYTTNSRLFMVPYHPFELGTSEVPPEYEMVLFRRHTMRVTEMLADEHNYDAIITGDSLGQVASQTMDNLRTVSAAVRMPIYRPLTGMNKNEIIQKAQRFETFDASTGNYRDCCSIQSKHPVTSSRISRVEQLEESVSINEIDRKALAEVELYPIDPADGALAPVPTDKAGVFHE